MFILCHLLIIHNLLVPSLGAPKTFPTHLQLQIYSCHLGLVELVTLTPLGTIPRDTLCNTATLNVYFTYK